MILINNNIYRGPRPKTLHDIRGINRIFSLQTGIYEVFVNDQYEYQIPYEFGMLEYNFPLSSITPPKRHVVSKILKVLTSADVATYIHCKHGVDRTGFICAVYRMQVQGWRYRDALDEWKSLGRHPWYWTWERELKAWDALGQFNK